jgi:hypothetical protein
VTAAVWREKFLVRPARNRTGDLSLMRQVWYHKTTASALDTRPLYMCSLAKEVGFPVRRHQLLHRLRANGGSGHLEPHDTYVVRDGRSLRWPKASEAIDDAQREIPPPWTNCTCRARAVRGVCSGAGFVTTVQPAERAGGAPLPHGHDHGGNSKELSVRTHQQAPSWCR